MLWAIIEAPLHGWSSALVIVTGVAGLVVLTGFVIWELRSAHPMLNLGFLRQRAFTGSVCSVGLVMFGLFGALFVLTQFLQFGLGYTALQAGIRVLPAAGAIAVLAPLSSVVVRAIGTKLTATAGLLFISGGLWQISLSSAATTYTGILPGIIALGVGAGLVVPAATALVMGSVPAQHTGVGAATNATVLQIGGALGVAVVGSLLSSRYQNRMSDAIAGYHLPPVVRDTLLSSVGGAQEVAGRVGGILGRLLVRAADAAFVSAMDLGLLAAAAALAGGLLALIVLPGKR